MIIANKRPTEHSKASAGDKAEQVLGDNEPLYLTSPPYVMNHDWALSCLLCAHSTRNDTPHSCPSTATID
ncbi:hypothetical protein SCLCIDRAFT_1221241 [Scleroderma citrinum Foug A]|uniref:Uncharacterized protein n=1 Tax=Scleroderma citrinum Foug A TaxID=1036808 RepID=A0A0C3DGR1_9AGAM|nr:hypothetical protein SCLCIDRAFT_1221241 [Scleroderma citrinum Foug A]